MATAASEREGAVIQGRFVPYPVIVREAASASATYLVDAAAARALLPCPDLDDVGLSENDRGDLVRSRRSESGLYADERRQTRAHVLDAARRIARAAREHDDDVYEDGRADVRHSFRFVVTRRRVFALRS